MSVRRFVSPLLFWGLQNFYFLCPIAHKARHLYTSTNADLSVQSRGWLSVDPRHLGNSENRLANFLEGKILKKIKKHSWHENQWKDFQNFDHNYILMTFFLKNWSNNRIWVIVGEKNVYAIVWDKPRFSCAICLQVRMNPRWLMLRLLHTMAKLITLSLHKLKYKVKS